MGDRTMAVAGFLSEPLERPRFSRACWRPAVGSPAASEIRAGRECEARVRPVSRVVLDDHLLRLEPSRIVRLRLPTSPSSP